MPQLKAYWHWGQHYTPRNGWVYSNSDVWDEHVSRSGAPLPGHEPHYDAAPFMGHESDPVPTGPGAEVPQPPPNAHGPGTGTMDPQRPPGQPNDHGPATGSINVGYTGVRPPGDPSPNAGVYNAFTRISTSIFGGQADIGSKPFRPDGGATCLTLLNGLVQGSKINTRWGATIRLRELKLRITVNEVIGGLTGADLLRVIVVYDLNANGLKPLVSDIMDTNGSGNAYGVNSFYSLNNRGRFVYLYDEIKIFQPFWTASQAVPAAYSQPIGCPTWHANIHCKDLVTQYNTGNTGSITDISTGALWLLLQAEWLSVTTVVTTTASSSIRLSFLDAM